MSFSLVDQTINTQHDRRPESRNTEVDHTIHTTDRTWN